MTDKQTKTMTTTNEIHGRVPLRNLRNWRVARALTLEELARRSGVAKSTLVRLEQGGSLAYGATVKRVAYALHITPDQLAYGDPYAASRF